MASRIAKAAALGPLLPAVIFCAVAGAAEQVRTSAALEPRICDIQGVHGVVVARARNATTRCVLHILDMHYVSWNWFLAWTRAREPDALNRDVEAIRAEYDSAMNEIETLQVAHESIICEIASRVGTSVVYLEGLPAGDAAAKEFLAAMRGGERHLHEVARNNPLVREFLNKYEVTKPCDISSTDFFKLKDGAAASLFLSGRLSKIEPVEDLDAFNTSAWLRQKGVYSRSAQEAREDAIAVTLLKAKMPALVVLGGGHYLADNLIRLSDDTCDCLQIESDAYHMLYRKVWDRGWLKPLPLKKPGQPRATRSRQ